MTNSGAVDGPGPDILLEVRPNAAAGDLAPRTVGPEQFRSRAGEIVESLQDIVQDFRERLGRQATMGDDDGGWRVGSIEVSFDIAVQAETGIVIARAGAGATFSAKIVLESRQDQRK